MKKIVLIFLLLLSGTFITQGQIVLTDINEQDITNDTISVTGTPTDDFVKVNIYFTNTGEEQIQVFVRKVEVAMVEGMTNNFCWNQFCYSYEVFEINEEFGQPIALEPGQTSVSEQFYTELWPDGQQGTAEVRYEFYSTRDLFEAVHVTLMYNISDQTSVQSPVAKSIQLMDASPNPASSGYTLIPYSIQSFQNNARLEIRNLLGKIVHSQVLDASDSRLRINTSQLTNGIYIYSLVVNGQPQQSKRLIITN